MSVLSLRKSVEALDDREAVRNTLIRCIEDVAQYAIEVNPDTVKGYRGNILRIADRGLEAHQAAHWEQLRADFRGELRNYRDETQQDVRRLREEVTIAVESMRCLIENVATSGTDHEQALRREFDTLEETAQTADVETIRSAIHHAAVTAIQSFEKIRHEQQLVITQLQEEIRGLHREVDQERRSAFSDPATGVWNRTKLDGRIKDLVLLNETFCVFLIGVPYLSKIAAPDARIAPGLLRALAGRLQTLAERQGEIGMTGRWGEDCFAVVFNLPLTSAPLYRRDTETVLSGSYALQMDGVSQQFPLTVRLRAVERVKDSPERAFYTELGRAAFEAVSA